MANEESGLSRLVLSQIKEALADADFLDRAELIDWREREGIMKFRFIPELIDSVTRIDGNRDIDNKLAQVQKVISFDEIGIVFAPDGEGQPLEVLTVDAEDNQSSLMIVFKHSVWDELAAEDGMAKLADSITEVLLEAYDRYESLEAARRFTPFWVARKQII